MATPASGQRDLGRRFDLSHRTRSLRVTAFGAPAVGPPVQGRAAMAGLLVRQHWRLDDRGTQRTTARSGAREIVDRAGNASDFPPADATNGITGSPACNTRRTRTGHRRRTRSHATRSAHRRGRQHLLWRRTVKTSSRQVEVTYSGAVATLQPDLKALCRVPARAACNRSRNAPDGAPLFAGDYYPESASRGRFSRVDGVALSTGSSTCRST
jgi:hypothetical protein